MTATDPSKSTSSPSQCDIILRMLTESRGQWVSMPDMMRESGSGSVHSRISNLRDAGHTIEWRRKQVGRRILSWYRIPLPEEPSASDL
jgi:biotin operon repressor